MQKHNTNSAKHSKCKYTYLSHVVQMFVSARYVQTQMLKAAITATCNVTKTYLGVHICLNTNVEHRRPVLVTPTSDLKA